MNYNYLLILYGSTKQHIWSGSPENFQNPDCPETRRFPSRTPDFLNFLKSKKQCERLFLWILSSTLVQLVELIFDGALNFQYVKGWKISEGVFNLTQSKGAFYAGRPVILEETSIFHNYPTFESFNHVFTDKKDNRISVQL